MEYYYFVIIVIIVLKILFWTFYFYVRAQRLRQTQTPRFIIIGAQQVTRAPSRHYTDRSAIIDHAEPVSALGPPPYAEVVKSGPAPPSYDQAMALPGAACHSGGMPLNTAAVVPGALGYTGAVSTNATVQVAAPQGAPGYTGAVSSNATVQVAAPPGATRYTGAVSN